MRVAGVVCLSGEQVVVPLFGGLSFLQFVGLQRTVLSFTDVELVIKPTARDGLVFYNGYVRRPTGDFISLALRDGFVEFRFDLGTGPAYIRYRRPPATFTSRDLVPAVRVYNQQGYRGDGISIPIPIPYPQKILWVSPQDPHTHRTPKSYISIPAPCLFTTRGLF